MCFPSLGVTLLFMPVLTMYPITQEIAPVYYDLDTFEPGDIKRSLTRAGEKKRRKEAMKATRR